MKNAARRTLKITDSSSVTGLCVSLNVWRFAPVHWSSQHWRRRGKRAGGQVKQVISALLVAGDIRPLTARLNTKQ